MTSAQPQWPVQSVPLSAAWSGNPLVADYLAGRGPATDFYRYAAGRAELATAIAARRRQQRAPAAALAAALRDYLAPFGPTPAMSANLDLLADPATVVVVTGQQPALFGGPLYTFYKAVTAVLEAERLRAEGVAAVPVFWNATEDDDFAEVRAVALLDEQHALQRLELAIAAPDQASVGPLPVPPGELERLLTALRAVLPNNSYRAELLQDLAADYGGRTLGAGFSAFLVRLLGARGLLVLDPMQPAIRALAAPVLARVLDDPLLPTRLSNHVGARLHEAGYRPATHRGADLCAFYLYRDGCRRRLSYDGEVFTTDADEVLHPADLHAELVDRPDHFSHSVLLRPVVQDYLLPTAGMVVGPGEIAYAAHVGPIYDALGVARPVLLPRRSATLLEPKAERVLQRYALAVTDFWHEPESLAQRVSRKTAGAETARLFEAGQLELDAVLTRLGEHAAAVDPSLRRTAEGAANRIWGQLAKLEHKVQRSLRQQNETLLRRLEFAAAQITPAGVMQERRVGMVGYLAAYGPRLVAGVSAALAAAAPEEHLVVRMDT